MPLIKIKTHFLSVKKQTISENSYLAKFRLHFNLCWNKLVSDSKTVCLNDGSD